MDELTAKTLRQRAWTLLSAPGNATGYGTYLLGLLLQTLVCIGFVIPLVIVFAATCGGMIALAQDGSSAQPTPTMFALSFVGATVVVFGILYIIGFCSWGQKSMSIAVNRGGLKTSHGVSGWGNGWRMVNLILWQQTFIFLWALLLIVPGIRAGFSYALAPYLQVDHPDWPPRKCIAESKRLMEGHRWRFFCLNFSFIGWYLLMIPAMYLVGNFAQMLLTPYVDTACAAFYEDLLDRAEGRKPAEPENGDFTAEFQNNNA